MGVLAITRRRPCLTGATMATASSLCVVVCLGLAILGTTALAAPVAPTSVHVTGGDARLTVEWEWPHAAAVTEFHINATTVDLNPPPGRNTLHREPHLVVIPTDPYTCAPRLAAVVPGLSNGARYAVSVVRGHDTLRACCAVLTTLHPGVMRARTASQVRRYVWNRCVCRGGVPARYGAGLHVGWPREAASGVHLTPSADLHTQLHRTRL